MTVFAPAEPAIKRVVTFFDGQNLYHAAKEAYGYFHPNYDVVKLSEHVAAVCGWNLVQVRFYTGIPDVSDNPRWNQFWTAKLAAMGRQVEVFSRPLRYRNKTISLAGGVDYTFLNGEEKGIDVRIALDVIRLANSNSYDVALIFGQDQDLSEVADEVRTIARQQRRWIKTACAFPSSPACHNKRGINGTDWIKIDRAVYDACIDPRDYRKQTPPKALPGKISG
jgi:uncharacterized LabA/DUF88 family protein